MVLIFFEETIFNCSIIVDYYSSAVFCFGSKLDFKNFNPIYFFSFSLSWTIYVLIPRPRAKPSVSNSYVNLVGYVIKLRFEFISDEGLQLSYKLRRCDDDSSSLPIHSIDKSSQVSIVIWSHFMSVNDHLTKDQMVVLQTPCLFSD